MLTVMIVTSKITEDFHSDGCDELKAQLMQQQGRHLSFFQGGKTLAQHERTYFFAFKSLKSGATTSRPLQMTSKITL